MSLFIYLLAVLNPFVQVLYLWDLLDRMPVGRFIAVYAQASALSLGVFIVMAIIGGPMLEYVFQIDINALRIFGGLIMVSIGFRRVLQQVETNEELADQGALPGAIAIPYIIGPGTIWISILIGERNAAPTMLGGMSAVVGANLLIVAGFALMIHYARSFQYQSAMRFAFLLMRTNALFIGAIGIDMVARGVLELLHLSETPI